METNNSQNQDLVAEADDLTPQTAFPDAAASTSQRNGPTDGDSAVEPGYGHRAVQIIECSVD